MYVTTITIGRNYWHHNVDQRTLPLQAWETYIDEAGEVLASLVSEWLEGADEEFQAWVEFSRGEGEWQGVKEQNATVKLISTGTLNARELGWTRRELQRLAGKYNQDAICLVANATSELISR